MDFIPKSDWTRFCDRFSRSLEGLTAEIDVASLDLGVQVEAKALPILGLTYDHQDDIIEVALEGTTHIVSAPREMHVEVTRSGVAAIAVKDGEGTRHLVKLTQPLALPHPEEASQQVPQPIRQ